MSRTTLDPDRSVPALLVKIGHYPLQHIGLGVVRTLGRIGVPVYAITEDRWTPAAVSRYCAGRFVQHSTGLEDPELLLSRLVEVGRQLGRPAIAVPTDEEAAVLLAEHATELSDYFLLPQVAPGLPRRLASKRGLYELCLESGIPAPASAFPATLGEVNEFAARASFPVVVKNLEAWVRRRAPVVPGTTEVLRTPEELLALATTWDEAPSVILQDYIPREDAEDWIVHLYCDADSDCVALFTGLKIRAWPPHAGMTACAYIVDNPGLAEMARRFCKQIGFSGIADLDWRLDRRDGEYKLVDFNPRVGSQFRLFETEAGIDVVRAMHLDLTGRRIPLSSQRNGRRFVAETLDGLAYLTYLRNNGYTTPAKPRHSTSTEFAWLAWDDPLPFAAMSARFAKPLAAYMTQTFRSRAARRQARKDVPSAPRRDPDMEQPGPAAPPTRRY
jgi:predicted ATP-grasp superfamily ATP-dependent carboligase